jgi:hypothetical protein
MKKVSQMSVVVHFVGAAVFLSGAGAFAQDVASVQSGGGVQASTSGAHLNVQAPLIANTNTNTAANSAAVVVNVPAAMMNTSAARGGGVIGSGGDGLILNGPSDGGNGDVVVPVPGELQTDPTIEVDGVSGAGQSSKYAYKWCALDAKLPCLTDYQTQDLGKPAMVKPGYITAVMYSGSLLSSSKALPIRVENGDHLVFSLKKIEVPKVDSTYKFSVYMDISDLKQRQAWWDQFDPNTNLQEVTSQINGGVMYGAGTGITYNDIRIADVKLDMSGNYDASFTTLICKAMSNGTVSADVHVQKLCQSLATLETTGVLASDTFLEYESDGTTDSIQVSCKFEEKTEGFIFKNTYYNLKSCQGEFRHNVQPQNLTQITDPNDGDFVSVFPGVYRIVFEAQDGSTSQVNGIHVD